MSPTVGMMHKIECQSEDPNFYRVRNQRSKNTKKNSKSVL
jgi:hypothetical protein